MSSLRKLLSRLGAHIKEVHDRAPEDMLLNLYGVIFWGTIFGVAFGMVLIFG